VATGIGKIVAWLMRSAVARPRVVLAASFVLFAVSAGLISQLSTDTSARTLLGDSSPSFAATERAQDRFGSDAVIIRIAGPVSRLVLTPDLNSVLGLEGCLAGKQALASARGPCARLAALQPAQAVIGPGTFINTSASQISEEYERRIKQAQADARRAANAATKLGRARGLPEEQVRAAAQAASQAAQDKALLELLQLGLRSGIVKPPTINDQNFVAQLVFAGGKEAGTPKARFAYLFPNKDTSLISVRLRPALSEAERRAAIADIRAAVEMPQWQLKNGGRYAVTGAPVVLADLTDSVSDALVVLSLVALLVMALTLALVFRARRRLTPLIVALTAATITFGVLSALGASLTIAAVAVAPILLGLVIDYALQIQTAPSAAATVAAAATTTAFGFLVLVLSPVPMVRSFGLLLVAGVAIGLVGALTLGPAIGALPALRRSNRLPGKRAVMAALTGAGEIARDNSLSRAAIRGGRRLQDAALSAAEVRPQRVLIIGSVLAVIGLAADTQVPVESDVIKLAPQNLASLQELRALQESTGVGGQIDVLIEGRRVTDPEVVSWMADYQRRILREYGYGARRGCGKADLCPAFSLPDLLSGFKEPTQKQIEDLLAVIPPSFSQSVITADRRSATVAFGIRLMSLDRQSEVIETMRSELDPPRGVTASVVGLPVLAADANAAISSPWRRLLTLLAGLVVVAVVLRVLLGGWRRALVPLVPIALAAGWAPLVLLVARVPLNPMSVTLSALVVAVATEFSVLLAERQRRERAAGRSLRESLVETYASTGNAVLASGATAIAGFAVLMASQITMLRDFGFVTVINLAVSLAAVMLALPAAIAVFGERTNR
jgi:hydrophobe/amphiphile efflux-3 (HAE3) family protein